MADALMTPEPAERRCIARTTTGSACDRRPLRGGEYCVAHDPARKPRRKPQARTGNEPLMTAMEVANLLGWSRASVYDAVRENRIPHRRIGRGVWFPRAAITRWLEGLEPDAATTAAAG